MSVAEAQPWTVSRLLAWTRGYFERQGLDSPRLCAEILLADALDCDRIHLFTRFDHTPEEAVLTRFRERVQRAATGYPIAYLIGYKEFFSLRFAVTPEVLIPRPETEVLVERTIGLVREAGLETATILDIGTGSGCIAVALAKHLPGVRITAGDVSAAALKVARENADRHGLGDRITFVESDLFAPLSADFVDGVDIIVSNPPYLATESETVDAGVRDHEPPGALFGGADGFAVIRRLLAEAPGVLRPGGHLLFEIAFDQSAAVGALLADDLWYDVRCYRDALGHERVMHVRLLDREQPPRAESEETS